MKLNIFGEKVIINPDSIGPQKGYYLYEVSKNIFEQENSVILISYFVKFVGKYILDYIKIFFLTILNLLKEQIKNLDNNKYILQKNN